MAVFKDYNGNILDVSNHTHVVSDTKRDGVTALATVLEDGFMSKDDRVKLTNLKTKLNTLDTKMQSAVYLNNDLIDNE